MARNRGHVSIRLSTYAASIDYGGAFGMGVVSAEALAAGVASVPEPFTQSDWPGWLLWGSFADHFELGTASSLLPGSLQIPVDSKAMRKMGQNEALILVCESQVGAIEVAMHIRTLVLFP